MSETGSLKKAAFREYRPPDGCLFQKSSVDFPTVPRKKKDLALLRTVFLFGPPGGILNPRVSPPWRNGEKKRTPHAKRARRSLFGPPGGIRTPGLWNRNPLRYPASPRADILCPAFRRAIVFYTVRAISATPKMHFSKIFPFVRPPLAYDGSDRAFMIG